MALTTIESNNKLIQFTKEINREFVRENLFSPYMGDSLNSIIRRRYELKSGGEQMNIPLVTKLTNAAIGVGTLVGNEEKIDNYGMRVYLDWQRNAVVTNKAESQKDSADVFGEAKPLLSDWGKELQRDQLIAALMALPSVSAPAGLGSNNGQPVNGILYEAATTAQKDTWRSNNTDRILYGNAVSNSATDHATSLALVDTTADVLKGSSLSLMKRLAMGANPAIRPYRTSDGYEWYVAFVGMNTFRDLKNDTDIKNSRLYAMTRQGGEDSNPLFQDGDVVYDGVIVRQVPEISGMVTDVWGGLLVGASSTRVEPVFLCGQQAAVMAWGQMAKPTFRKEDDYGFITGAGVEMAYGVAKMFKAHPNTGTVYKQWGVVTGFFAGGND